MSTAQQYAEHQRERLAQIRAATEKERLLLHTHRTIATGLGAAADGGGNAAAGEDGAAVSPSRRGGQPPASPTPTSRAAQQLLDPHVQPPHVPQPSSSLLERLAYGTRPSVVIANQLSGRAQELEAQEETLRQEDDELQHSEALMERRVEKLNSLKKELLQRLVMLQGMEVTQRDAEQRLDGEMADLLKQHESIRERQREGQHQRGLAATEQAQREAALAAGRAKLLDRAGDMQRAAGRMRQQQQEQAERVQGLELLRVARQRLVEDLERDAARDEGRLRDIELQAAADLRAEIERRQAGLAATAMR